MDILGSKTEKWAFETLLDAIKDKHGKDLTRNVIQRDMLMITDHAWYKYKKVGLDDYESDEMAIRIGKHPAEIWTDWLGFGFEEEDFDEDYEVIEVTGTEVKYELRQAS